MTTNTQNYGVVLKEHYTDRCEKPRPVKRRKGKRIVGRLMSEGQKKGY